MEQRNPSDVLILAIESSCDETAASVVKNGREVLSNTIYTQIALHTQFGGVVPEIASRKHIEKINQVIEQALQEANVRLEDMDAIMAASKPYTLEEWKKRPWHRRITASILRLGAIWL